jgi:uncharacterized lipoprotein NlpE involved in copper resistance
MALLSDDRDRDQLPDTWELMYLSSVTNTAGGPTEDWDSDGMSDRSEYISGTSPVDSLDYLAIRSAGQTAASDGVSVSWNSVTARLYTVTIATNLYSVFTDALDFVDVEGTGGIMTYTNRSGLDGSRFYRIKVRMPQ